MTLIDRKPAGLKPQNDLDAIPEDLLGPVPQMIRLSARDLFIMDRPPATGEYIKAEFIMQAGDLLIKAPGSDGVEQNVRIMRYIGAKLTVEPYTPDPESPPVPDDDQDAMIGRDGEISGGLDEFDPEFSHNGAPDPTDD